MQALKDRGVGGGADMGAAVRQGLCLVCLDCDVSSPAPCAGKQIYASSTLHPQLSTLNPQSSILNPQPSILILNPNP